MRFRSNYIYQERWRVSFGASGLPQALDEDEQRDRTPTFDRTGRFVALASGLESDTEALPIRADARVLGATLKAGESAEHVLAAGRLAYLVPAKGRVEVNGVVLDARDGAAIDAESSIKVVALDDAELVLVDVTR